MGRHRSLAQFELFVMLAIESLGDDAWSVPILDAIEHGSGRKSSLGAVYATVARLEEKGLVDRRAGVSRPRRRGRARNHFLLSSDGKRELDKTRTMLQRMLRYSSDAPSST